MTLKVYNVLTRKKEVFIPQEENDVKMYACGITVSDNAHIGHAYQAVIFDTIRKYLRYKGYNVKYVRNYTDVDDKIIINARKNNMNPIEYAEKYISKTEKELKALEIESPTIQARATECICDMIDFIQKLIDKGHAYAAEDGSVYFRVSSFDKYGSFSNRIIEESLNGVRKNIEPGKEDDKDFALWKSAGTDEIYWDSPWGKGRPGWHIECSTMSMKYLGETLDIHGGGKDLMFPHHENEIAQSEALTGKQFSKYWLHNGLVKINGQKMSKSLGNGILIEDLVKNYDSDVIKMTLLQNNYRSDLNIVDGIFEQNENQIYMLYKTLYLVDKDGSDYIADQHSDEYKMVRNNFEEAMDNDFNTSAAISYLFNYTNMINKLLAEKDLQQAVNIKTAIIDVYGVLGMFQKQPESVISKIKNKYLELNDIQEDEIKRLLAERKEYKAIKNYDAADEIREKLFTKGIIIKDIGNETEWDIKMSQKK